MDRSREVHDLRVLFALLRITLGVILLATWYDNLTKGVYSAEGIRSLFAYLFEEMMGGLVSTGVLWGVQSCRLHVFLPLFR